MSKTVSSKRNNILLTGCAAVLAGCLGLTGCTASPPAPATTSTFSGPGSDSATPGDSGLSALQAGYEQTIRNVLPSVVLIQTGRDLGSGVIFDSKGDIVTNDHVVGNAKTFTVNISGSAKPFKATLVGTYPVDDLAVIKIEGAPKLTPLQFADAASTQVGEIVLAIGNPLGLASSVTEGIISATGRTVSEPQGSDSPGATLPDSIQTSAAINPGNSGGALVNLSGRLVGIPTLAATDQQLGGGAAPGIGFAIASSIVKDVASQIVAHGKVTVSHRAALGASVTSVTDQNGNSVGVGIVAVTSGGAADSAGLTAGEIITAINNTPTPNTEALSEVLANLQPGQHVAVKILQTNGTPKTIQIILGRLSG